MARARPMPMSAVRITAYVKEKFGSTRVAADTLGCDHATLWRAMQGFAVNGPSADICERLEKHSGKPMSFWRGRGE